MGFFTLEGLLGRVEVVVFSDLYEKVQHLLAEESKVFITGKPTSRSSSNQTTQGNGNGNGNGAPSVGEIKMLAEDIIPLESVRQRMARIIYVKLPKSKIDSALVKQLSELANRSRGSSELRFQISDDNDEHDETHDRRIRATKLRVAPTHALLVELRKLVGQKNVWVAKT